MNYFFRLAENWCPEASGETSSGGTSGHCEQKRWNGSTLGLTRKSVSTTTNIIRCSQKPWWKCLQVVRVGVYKSNRGTFYWLFQHVWKICHLFSFWSLCHLQSNAKWSLTLWIMLLNIILKWWNKGMQKING